MGEFSMNIHTGEIQLVPYKEKYK
ncbi:GNAT family N-acetyltransferase, partial [Bacillus cereus]|nr:GNAT family N-acetyltransferase [Bacillus cereus]